MTMALLRLLRAPLGFERRFRAPASLKVTCALSTNAHVVAEEGLDSQSSLKSVTVINNASEAAYAIKTLLELGPNKYVAWSSQESKLRGSEESQPFTISAYAGKKVDFGNGPHLFLSSGKSAESKRVWQMFQKYFEDEDCSKVWFNYNSTLTVQMLTDLVPRGLVGEVVNMAKLTTAPTGSESLDNLAKIFLRKRQLDEAQSILEEDSVPLAQGNSRPWEAKLQDGGCAYLDNRWIASACIDARLTYMLFEELRKQLKETSVHGINSTEDFSSELTNLYEVYSYFFVPLVCLTHDMQQRGLSLKPNSLRTAKLLHWERVEALKNSFLTWATEFSPDAALIDLNSSAQLGHLLFAPCINRRNKKEKWPKDKQFKVLDTKHKADQASNGKSRKQPKITINISGRGATPKVYTPSGWPSASKDALRKAAGFPNSSEPSYGQRDKRFCHAVDHLLTAKQLESQGIGHIDYLGNLTDPSGRVKLPFTIEDKTGLLSCDVESEGALKFIKKEVCADEGKSLVVGEFDDLGLSLLAQMSQSDKLRERLVAEANSQEIGAYHLFETVQSAIDSGECGFSPNGTQSRGCVAEEYPLEYHRSKVLDENMAAGGSLTALRRDLELRGYAGKKLMDRWFKHHPEVKTWIDHTVAFAKANGFVETMLGRRKLCSNLDAKSTSVRDMARTSAMRYIVSGSVGETVMGAIRKLGSDETLQALDWHVVFVDGTRIVLEGPSYATEEVIPIVSSRMTAPMDFQLDMLLDVSVTSGSSITSIEMDRSGAT